MKRVLLLPVLVPLAACAVHIHIHEAPKSEPAITAATHETTAPADSVSGVVVDMEGRPIRAHVSAVDPSGGSMALGTDEQGRFAIHELRGSEVVLHASTDDDRMAVQSQVRLGTSGIQLVARPGGSILIGLAGIEKCRCAIFDGPVRLEDFTLRAGKAERVVVPSGDIRLQLYDGDKTHAERTLHLEVGERKEISLTIPS